MADKKLKIAVVLGAQDNMSSVVESAVARSKNSMSGLNGATFAKGLMGAAGAYGGMAAFKSMNDKFESQQYSLANLRIMEMNKLGKVNEAVYGKEEKYITDLSAKYSKSVEDYTKMVVVLRQNRISPEDIMGGIGETTAQLSKVFDNMDPDTGALFFARLKNDMGVSAKDMSALANMAFKLKNIGVGKDANETLYELTEAYSKASIGAKVLGMGGAKDAEDMGKLMGVFLSKGLSGSTVGTSFRKIFDGIRDVDRQKKVLEASSKYGIRMTFFDENGNFQGLPNFINQLAKLRRLTTEQRAEVLKSFSGKQGLSNEEVEYLSKFGGDIEEINNQYDNLTNLTDAVKELTGTLRIQKSVMKSNFENMQAAFGKSMQDDMGRVYSILNSMTLAAKKFADTHPSITRMSTEFALMASGAGGLYGSLLLAGRYIPTLGAMLEGIAAGTFFTAFASITASLLIGKEILTKFSHEAEKQKNLNPNSEKSRLIKGYDSIIENPETGVIKRNMARLMKAGIGGNTFLFGDKSEGSGFDVKRKKDAYDWAHGGREASEARYKANSSFYYNKANGGGAPITYSPTINITGNGVNGEVTKENISALLRGNIDELVGMLRRENDRQGNMSYGNEWKPIM